MSIRNKIQVNKKIPFHDAIKQIHQRWKFSEASVKVDENYVYEKDALGNPIIKRFDCEVESNYKKRLQRTSARNLISNIINQYSGSVFRTEPERDPSIAEFAKNADGRGKSLNAVMNSSLIHCLVYGFGFTLIENQTGGALSIAQAKQIGEEPRVIAVDPWSIVNWKRIDGYLIEALISFQDEEGNSFVRLYDSSTVTDIFIDDKATVKSISEPIPHGFSSIPISFMELEIINDSFIQPLAQIQMNINNLLSLLGQEQASQCFTRWVFSGIPSFDGLSTEDKKELTINWGSNDIIILPDQATIDRLGADRSQADSLRASIQNDTEELLKAAGIAESVSRDASGEARKLAREAFKTTASIMSTAVELAENGILNLLGEITGRSFADTFYSRDYDEPDFSESINQLRDILALDFGDENEAIKSEAIKQFKATFFIN